MELHRHPRDIMKSGSYFVPVPEQGESLHRGRVTIAQVNRSGRSETELIRWTEKRLYQRQARGLAHWASDVK